MQNLSSYEFAIQLMGMSMCLFMALFFLMDSKDKPAKTTKYSRRLLANFLFIYSLTFLNGVLATSDVNFQYPHTYGLFIPVYFLLGPYLYFYIREMCSKKSQVNTRPTIKHLIPPILSIIILTPFFILSSNNKQIIFTENVLDETGALLPWIAIFCVLIVQVLLHLQILFYLVQSFRVVLRYFTNLKQFFSNIDDTELDWLRNLILMLSISWMLFTYQTFISWPNNANILVRMIASVTDVSVIYFLCFKALRQVVIFRDQIAEQNDTSPQQISNGTESNKQKYANSALSDEDADRIFSKLQNALNNDRLYKDSMLSLRGLSDHTKISTNYISQVINQKTDSHFFDYVNRFRINAAKIKLSDNNKKCSILDIAYSVGFNSKSTFNTAFKRYTDLTPSEYRKNNTQIM